MLISFGIYMTSWFFVVMDRRDRLSQIIRLTQDRPLSSLEIKARFPRISARSIERDIEHLAQEGRIQKVSHPRIRNAVWESSEKVSSIDVRGMSGHAAATLSLIEGKVKKLLPSFLLAEIQPLFDHAEKVLRQAHNRECADLVGRIHIMSSERVNLSSRVHGHLLELRDAIMRQRTLCLELVNPQGGVERMEGVSPLGLIIGRTHVGLVIGHPDIDQPIRVCVDTILSLGSHHSTYTMPDEFELHRYV